MVQSNPRTQRAHLSRRAGATTFGLIIPFPNIIAFSVSAGTHPRRVINSVMYHARRRRRRPGQHTLNASSVL